MRLVLRWDVYMCLCACVWGGISSPNPPYPPSTSISPHSSSSSSPTTPGHGGPPKLRLYTPVLQRLWAEKRIEEARAVWEEMVGKGAVPNEEHVISMVR